MKITPVLAVVPAFLLCACTTLGSFQDVDENRDGAVSREEASHSESLTSLFNSADDDRDGVLNEEEYALVHRVITQGRRETTPRRRTMTEKGGPDG